ncbi:hypothetical protein Pcinc_031699 [Petrolisthes cinctipes]|uniref:BZIP domain-containing protein n=1 Tax=Petrolisthes cinctipes TaxID=88211 RepID=A0AAE1EW60_PETCI|nr:hypothetical protein Pcinc_031699 [Petrolisthes cinctipes]
MESSGSDGYHTSDPACGSEDEEMGVNGDTMSDLMMRRKRNAVAAKKYRDKEQKRLEAEKAQRDAEPIIKRRMALVQLHYERQLDQARKAGHQLKQKQLHYEQLVQKEAGLTQEKKRKLLNKMKEIEDYASTLPYSHKAKPLLYKIVNDLRARFGNRLEYGL